LILKNAKLVGIEVPKSALSSSDEDEELRKKALKD
jgi:hypothetical protein